MLDLLALLYVFVAIGISLWNAVLAFNGSDIAAINAVIAILCLITGAIVANELYEKIRDSL